MPARLLRAGRTANGRVSIGFGPRSQDEFFNVLPGTRTVKESAS